MARQAKTYPTGEPVDKSLAWVLSFYGVLIALFVVSFTLSGHGGALFGLVLLAVRLALFVAVPVGLWCGIRNALRGQPIAALMWLLLVPLAVIGLVLLAPL